MKNVNNENYYAYDEANIAKSLQKAMNDNADPGVVKYLNEVRKKKIESNMEGLGQYKNDNLTLAADAYAESFKKPNIERINEARIRLNAERLKQAYSKIQNAYDSGSDAISQTAAESRRLVAAQEQKNRFETEDMLANAGLGRGAYSKASSGFSESARAQLISQAAQRLMQTYTDEQAKKAELAGEAAQAVSQAKQTYAQNADAAYSQLESDMINLDNNDKKTRTELMNMAAQNRHDERDFEYAKEKDNYEFQKDEREYADKKIRQEYDNAMSAFEMTGVVQTQKQAEILGIPIGTKSEFMEELTYRKLKEANEYSSAEKQNEFNNAYNMFVSTGVVQNQKQANILGVAVGTKYWEYVVNNAKVEVSKMTAAASQTSARASVMSASASQTNAAANYKNAQTNAKNAETKAEESRINQKKVEEQIETSKEKRERAKKIDNY